MSSFIPQKNLCYGLSFSVDESTVGLLTFNHGLSCTFHSLEQEGPEPTGGQGSYWLFLDMDSDFFLLANVGYGSILTTYDSNTKLEGLDSIGDNTATVLPVAKDEGIYLFLTNVSGYICRTGTGANDFGITTDINAAVAFNIYEQSDMKNWVGGFPDPLPYSMPPIPTFTDGWVPQLFPETSDCLLNEQYIPYCFVNDQSLPTFSDQITNSPYYILRQYGQYKLSTSLRNATTGTATFVEDWQYGWSDAQSSSFSDQIGIDVGGSVEGNEIFVKETLNSSVNDNLGISVSETAGESGSSTKQIRAEVLPNTSIAIYGLTTNYELFQMTSEEPLPTYSDPMKMSSGFLTISDPSPEA